MEGLKLKFKFYANEQTNLFRGGVSSELTTTATTTTTTTAAQMCMCHFKLKIINFLWKKSLKKYSIEKRIPAHNSHLMAMMLFDMDSAWLQRVWPENGILFFIAQKQIK